MRRKRILCLVSGLFYLCMAVLGMFAKKLHTASLPKVRIGYLEQRSFWVEESQEFLPALPQELYGTVLYYLSEEEKNGEVRYIARKIENLSLGGEVDGYYPVVDGMSAYWPVITEVAEELKEGQEVFVENEEDLKSWY